MRPSGSTTVWIPLPSAFDLVEVLAAARVDDVELAALEAVDALLALLLGHEVEAVEVGELVAVGVLAPVVRVLHRARRCRWSGRSS